MQNTKWAIFATLLVLAAVLFSCGTPSAPATTTANPSPATQPSPAPRGITLNGAGATFPAPLYTKWFDYLQYSITLKVTILKIGNQKSYNFFSSPN